MMSRISVGRASRPIVAEFKDVAIDVVLVAVVNPLNRKP